MDDATLQSIKALAEWAVKYWPLLGFGAGGLLWFFKFMKNHKRDKLDGEVLALLPKQVLMVFGSPFVVHYESKESIAKKVGRSVEKTTESLVRLREKGLAKSENGYWYIT